MLTLTLLKKYREQYVSAPKSIAVAKSSGLAVALILLADLHKPASSSSVLSDEKAEEPLEETLSSALELAVEIDLKNIQSLDSDSQKIVKELHLLLKDSSKSFFITSLEDALSILGKNSELSNQTQHVMRVLKAINIAQQSTDEELAEKTLMRIVLPKEGEHEFQFYFHRENYATIEQRRNALNRLNEQLITIWNDSLENNQLEFFLNSIQAGPCIEGATREPLTQAVLRVQKASAIPTRFREAMDRFYHQAENLFTHLKFVPLPNNIKQIILAVYNGRECLPYVDKDNNKDPTVFSDETVQKYLTELGLYTSNYFSADPVGEYVVPDHFPVVIRHGLLTAIVPYANPEHTATLLMLKYLYSQLISMCCSKVQAVNVNECLGIIIQAKAINAYINGKDSLFKLIARTDNAELIKVLVQMPALDLTQSDADDLSNLYWLLARASLNTLANDSDVIDKLSVVPAEIWYRRVNTPSGLFGACPLFLLAVGSHDDVKRRIYDLIKISPELFQNIPREVLCEPLGAPLSGYSLLSQLAHQEFSFENIKLNIATLSIDVSCPEGDHSGYSALYWLTFSKSGAEYLVKNILKENPSFLKNLPEKVFFTGPKGYKNSILSNLIINEISRHVVPELLRTHPTLLSHISPEFITNPIDGKKSLLEILNDGSQSGEDILEALSTIPRLKAVIRVATLDVDLTAAEIAKNSYGLLDQVLAENLKNKVTPTKKLILDKMEFILEHLIQDIPTLDEFENLVKAATQTKDAIGLLKQPNMVVIWDKSVEAILLDTTKQTDKTTSYQNVLKMFSDKRKTLEAKPVKEHKLEL